jgi:hypothetical protein
MFAGIFLFAAADVKNPHRPDRDAHSVRDGRAADSAYLAQRDCRIDTDVSIELSTGQGAQHETSRPSQRVARLFALRCRRVGGLRPGQP